MITFLRNAALILAFAASQDGVRPLTEAKSVFAIYTEDWGLMSDGGSHLILALWEDGTIVWSEDPARGGPPYRSGRIERSSLPELLTSLERDGRFDDRDLSQSRAAIDSKFTTILARWKGRELLLRLGPEMESAPDGLAPRHQRFLRVWKAVRTRASRLLPAEGVVVEGELIAEHGVFTWRQKTP